MPSRTDIYRAQCGDRHSVWTRLLARLVGATAYVLCPDVGRLRVNLMARPPGEVKTHMLNASARGREVDDVAGGPARRARLALITVRG